MTLLIVLLSLGLVLLLVVSYLASVTSAVSDSDAYATNLNVQEVANSALQIVLSQIKTGTTGGTTVAWASQPGAIRTYDNAGNALAVYKLYSDPNMIVTIGNGGTLYNPANDWAPSTWSTTPGLYVDLNEPVQSNGANVYPILDPAATGTVTTAMDAAATGTDTLVEGCSINSSASPVLNATNTAAMPIRWIYELKDGTMVVPTTATGSVTTIPNASNTNPPVARFAFWTDDETCKLNVNTASEGSYWDTPYALTASELYFDRYGPATNEFQRYPGHPASTCLSPVFWSLWGLPGPESSLQPSLAPASLTTQGDATPTLGTNPLNYFQGLFGILPRVVWGGSNMGTSATVGQTYAGLPSTSLDSDRLFASVDEFLFARPTVNYPPRPVNSATVGTTTTPFSQSTLEKFRFFLTANSKAPDVNMFNQPKICMWPLNDTTQKNPNARDLTNTLNQRSPIDQLIAFASTINGYNYYFIRNDPYNPVDDFTTGSRNQTLYNYLSNAMTLPIPGFGAAFTSRYNATPQGNTTSECNQIITEIYDYIRSCINLVDTSDTNRSNGGTVDYLYSFAPGVGGYANETGEAVVVPFVHPSNGTKGIGRFVTVKEAVVWFIAMGANQPPVMCNSAGAPVDASGNVITSATQSFVANPLHPWTGIPPTTLPSPTFTGGILQDPFALAQPPTSNTYNIYPTLTLNAAGTTVPPQTHSGMPYLTKLDPANGTYDLANPRYQGPPTETASTAPLPALAPGQTVIRAIFFVNTVCNSPCKVGINPAEWQTEVTGLNAFTAGGTPLGFQSDATHTTILYSSNVNSDQYSIENAPTDASIATAADTTSNVTWYSVPVVVTNTSTNPTNSTFSFTGGTITVTIKSPSYTINGKTSGSATLQTLNINFPSGTFPVPKLVPCPPYGYVYTPQPSPATADTAYSANYPPLYTDDLVPSTLLTFDAGDALGQNPMTGVNITNQYGSGISRLTAFGYADQKTVGGVTVPDPSADPNAGPGANIFLPERPLANHPTQAVPPTAADDAYKLTCDTIRAVEFTYGDTRVESCLTNVPSSMFSPHADYFSSTIRPAHSLRGDSASNAQDSVETGATVQPLNNAAVPLVYYNSTTTGMTNTYYAGTSVYGGLGVGNSVTTQSRPALGMYSVNNTIEAHTPTLCVFPHTVSSTDFSGTNSVSTAFLNIWANGGDFDNGIALHPDGPYINKPDEGTLLDVATDTNPNFGEGYEKADVLLGSTLFSPNRLIPSPVVFGSLPAGVDPLNPSLNSSWQTLLFCPNPGSPTHVGLGANPPDYALLDFFHMPVVEPYAISEPLSTAGMINMNYQIVPFSYIKRDTALRGVLKSVMLAAIPDSDVHTYKTNGVGANYGFPSAEDTTYAHAGWWAYRYPISATQTLMQFDAKFATNDIFHSPSQICSIWLYPAMQPTAAAPNNPATPLVNYDSANANISAWWYNNPGTTRKSLTGTNLRDRPYALLYPRLTTKSNTYTIHVRAQVLRVPGNSGNTLDETTTKTIGEWRGSFLVERYIDPNNTALPDFASNTTAAVDPYYTFRILSTRRFSP